MKVNAEGCMISDVSWVPSEGLGGSSVVERYVCRDEDMR